MPTEKKDPLAKHGFDGPDDFRQAMDEQKQLMGRRLHAQDQSIPGAIRDEITSGTVLPLKALGQRVTDTLGITEGAAAETLAQRDRIQQASSERREDIKYIDKVPLGQDILGAGIGIAQQLPLMFGGGALGGAKAVIGSFAVLEGNEAYYRAIKANLSVEDSLRQAGIAMSIEAGFSAVGAKFGAGWLENAPSRLLQSKAINSVKKSISQAAFDFGLKKIAPEVLEEISIEIAHNLSADLGGVDNDAFTWENNFESAKQAAIQSVMMSAGFGALESLTQRSQQEDALNQLSGQAAPADQPAPNEPPATNDQQTVDVPTSGITLDDVFQDGEGKSLADIIDLLTAEQEGIGPDPNEIRNWLNTQIDDGNLEFDVETGAFTPVAKMPGSEISNSIKEIFDDGVPRSIQDIDIDTGEGFDTEKLKNQIDEMVNSGELLYDDATGEYELNTEYDPTAPPTSPEAAPPALTEDELDQVLLDSGMTEDELSDLGPDEKQTLVDEINFNTVPQEDQPDVTEPAPAPTPEPATAPEAATGETQAQTDGEPTKPKEWSREENEIRRGFASFSMLSSATNMLDKTEEQQRKAAASYYDWNPKIEKYFESKDEFITLALLEAKTLKSEQGTREPIEDGEGPEPDWNQPTETDQEKPNVDKKAPLDADGEPTKPTSDPNVFVDGIGTQYWGGKSPKDMTIQEYKDYRDKGFEGIDFAVDGKKILQWQNHPDGYYGGELDAIKSHYKTKPAETTPAETTPEPTVGQKDNSGREFIGLNQDGKQIWQNENGVRGIKDGGLLKNEPVSVIPTRAGVETEVRNRRDEYKTRQELLADRYPIPTTVDSQETSDQVSNALSAGLEIPENVYNEYREFIKKPQPKKLLGKHPVVKNRKKAVSDIVSASEFYRTSDLDALSQDRLIEIYDRVVREKLLTRKLPKKFADGLTEVDVIAWEPNTDYDASYDMRVLKPAVYDADGNLVKPAHVVVKAATQEWLADQEAGRENKEKELRKKLQEPEPTQEEPTLTDQELEDLLFEDMKNTSEPEVEPERQPAPSQKPPTTPKTEPSPKPVTKPVGDSMDDAITDLMGLMDSLDNPIQKEQGSRKRRFGKTGRAAIEMDRGGSKPAVNDQLLRATAKVFVQGARVRKWTDLGQFVDYMAQIMGPERVASLRPAIEQGWDRIRTIEKQLQPANYDEVFSRLKQAPSEPEKQDEPKKEDRPEKGPRRTPQPPRADDKKPLGKEPTVDDESVPTDGEDERTAEQRSGEDSGSTGEDEAKPSESNRDRGDDKQGIPGPAGSSVGKRSLGPGLVVRQARNDASGATDWVISDTEFVKGGSVKKLKQNIEAVHVFRKIKEENRHATPEEQLIISKFTGWGHLKQFFIAGPKLKRQNLIDSEGNFDTDLIDKMPTNNTKETWQKNLLQQLTVEEYESARNSVRNSHYTDPYIAKAMWGLLDKILPKTSRTRVLETSEGSGIFWGTMPDSLYLNSEMHGVDKDEVSLAVSKALYPSVNHNHIDMGEYSMPDGYFDIAISNVPFGKFNVVESATDDKKMAARMSRESIHNYFLAKTGLKLREGGVAVMITTHHTMDAADQKARTLIQDTGMKFMGAVRLHNDAFGSIANTKVVTDVIVFQKDSSVVGKDTEWLKSSEMSVRYTDPKNSETAFGEVNVAEYFQRNPENVLGNLTGNGQMTMTFPELTVEPSGNIDLPKILGERLATVTVDTKLWTDKAGSRSEIDPEKSKYLISIPEHFKNIGIGSLVIHENALYSRTSEEAMSLVSDKGYEMDGKARKRFEMWSAIRDTLSELNAAQINPLATDAHIEALRKKLNDVYDEFVKPKNGYNAVNAAYNATQFGSDLDFGAVSAIEDYTKGTLTTTNKKGELVKKTTHNIEKASIFTKRTAWPEGIEAPPITPEQVVQRLFRDGAEFDMDVVAQYLNTDPQAAKDQIESYVVEIPTGGYQIREVYLSGNIGKKLQEAEEAALQDKKWEKNVNLLRSVMPEPKKAGEFAVVLNSPYMPPKFFGVFVERVLGVSGFRVSRGDPGTSGGFIVDTSKVNDVDSVQNTNEYAAPGTFGNSGRTGLEILTRYIEGKSQKIMYRDMDGMMHLDEEATRMAELAQKNLETEFQSWVHTEPLRSEEVTDAYNKAMGGFLEPKIPHWAVSLKGMAEAWKNKIRERLYQLEGAARVALGNNTLLAYKVGFGKTLTAITGIMEQRRLGVARKPVVVVPNHLVNQWGRDFKVFYPNSKVLVATKKDLDPMGRSRFFNRIRTGDWDAVIVPSSSFKLMPMSPEYTEDYFRKTIDDITARLAEMEATGKSDRSDRSIVEWETMIEKLEKMLSDSLNKAEKDPGPFFDELGVDSLTVDEAHDFKNLMFFTRSHQTPGLNPQGNQKTFDMLMKTDFINTATNGRNVTFITGTPIANSMAESWVMMRYLMPETMRERNMMAFDDWKQIFGELETVTRIDTVGQKYRTETRFNKFVNIEDLRKAWSQMAHTLMKSKRVDTPPLKGGSVEIEVVKPPRFVRDYALSLAKRAGNVPKDKSVDNILKIMSDGSKGAMDMRLIENAAMPSGDTKITAAAKSAADIYHKTASFKGAQIIWADRGVPKKPKKLSANLKAIAQWIADESASTTITLDDLLQEYNSLTGAEDANQKGRDLKAIVAFLKEIKDDVLFVDGDPDDGVNIGTKEEPYFVRGIERADPDIASEDPPAWNVYKEAREQLVANGVKEEEIAFIYDYDTPAKKLLLYDLVNNGSIRILIGSTIKMGTGVNIQERLVAAHHLDAPWRPADVEQRDGRIIRSGNKAYYMKDGVPAGYIVEAGLDWNGVIVRRYVTEGSIDARYWDTLEQKARMLEQFYNGDAINEMTDIGDSSMEYADIKAASSANPLFAKLIELNRSIEALVDEKTSVIRKKAQMRADVKFLEGKIERDTKALKTLKEANKKRAEALAGLPEGVRSRLVTVDGKQLDKPSDIGQHVIDEAAKTILDNKIINISDQESFGTRVSATTSGDPILLGKMNGVDMYVNAAVGWSNKKNESVFGFNNQGKKILDSLPDKEDYTFGITKLGVFGTLDGAAEMNSAGWGIFGGQRDYKINPQSIGTVIGNKFQPKLDQEVKLEDDIEKSKDRIPELKSLADITFDGDKDLFAKQKEASRLRALLGSDADDQVDYWVASQELIDLLGDTEQTRFMLGRSDSGSVNLGYILDGNKKIQVYNRNPLSKDDRPPHGGMVWMGEKHQNSDAFIDNENMGYFDRDSRGVKNQSILGKVARKAGPTDSPVGPGRRIGRGRRQGPTVSRDRRPEQKIEREMGLRKFGRRAASYLTPGPSKPATAPASQPATSPGVFAKGGIDHAVQKDIKAGTRSVGLRSIAEYLNKIFAVKMIVTNSQTTKTNPAHYRPNGAVVFTRTGTWDLNIHEAGHAMDGLIKDKDPKWYDAYEQRLIDHAKQSKHASADNSKEGVAELVREYVIGQDGLDWRTGNPNTTNAKLTQEFIDLLGRVDPAMLGALKDARAAYARHKSRAPKDQQATDRNDKALVAKPSKIESLSNSFWTLSERVIGDGVLLHRQRRRVWKDAAGESALAMLDPTGVIGQARRLFDSAYEGRRKIAKAIMANEGTHTDVSMAHQSRLRSSAVALQGIQGDGVSVYVPSGFNLSQDEQDLLNSINFPLPAQMAASGNLQKITDKSLEQIMQAVSKDEKIRQDFQSAAFDRVAYARYKAAGHAYPGQTDGLTPKMLKDRADEAFKKNPEWNKHFDDLERFMNQLLTLGLISGSLTVNDIAAITTKYDHYLPLMKQMENTSQKGGGGGGKDPNFGYRRAFGGSELPYRDLHLQIMERVREAVTAFHENEFRKAVLARSQELGNEKALPYSERKEFQRTMIRLTLDRTVKAKVGKGLQAEIIADGMNRVRLDDLGYDTTGMSVKEVREHLEFIGETPFDPKEINLSIPGIPSKTIYGHKRPDLPNVIGVWENGELSYFHVPDHLNYAMFVKSGGQSELISWINRMLNGMAEPFKRTITESIKFAVRNFPRDMFTAAWNADTVKGSIVGYYAALGVVGQLTGNNYSKEAKEASRTMARSFDATTGHEHFTRLQRFKEVMKEGIYVQDWTWADVPGQTVSVLTWPVNVFNYLSGGRALSKWTESITREGAYIDARKRGLNPEKSHERFDKISGNFAHRQSNKAVAQFIRSAGFLNPSLQILWQSYEAVTHPDPSKRIKLNAAKSVFIGTAAGAAAAVNMALIYAMFGDDEEELEAVLDIMRERDEKEKFGNAAIFGWFRMPFDYGMSGAVASTSWNLVEDSILDTNIDGKARAMEIIKRTLSFPGYDDLIPPYIKLILEQVKNKSFYTGRDIVPTNMLKAMGSNPQLQYYWDTPEIYKQIGSATDISPLRIQHAVRGFMSSIMDDTIKFVDSIIKDDVDAKEFPVWRGLFISEPRNYSARSVRAVDEMAEQYQSLNTALNKDETLSEKQKVNLREKRDTIQFGFIVHKEIEDLREDIRQEQKRDTPDYERIKGIEKQIRKKASDFINSDKISEETLESVFTAQLSRLVPYKPDGSKLYKVGKYAPSMPMTPKESKEKSPELWREYEMKKELYQNAMEGYRESQKIALSTVNKIVSSRLFGKPTANKMRQLVEKSVAMKNKPKAPPPRYNAYAKKQYGSKENWEGAWKTYKPSLDEFLAFRKKSADIIDRLEGMEHFESTMIQK